MRYEMDRTGRVCNSTYVVDWSPPAEVTATVTRSVETETPWSAPVRQARPTSVKMQFRTCAAIRSSDAVFIQACTTLIVRPRLFVSCRRFIHCSWI